MTCKSDRPMRFLYKSRYLAQRRIQALQWSLGAGSDPEGLVSQDVTPSHLHSNSATASLLFSYLIPSTDACFRCGVHFPSHYFVSFVFWHAIEPFPVSPVSKPTRQTAPQQVSTVAAKHLPQFKELNEGFELYSTYIHTSSEK